MTIVISIVILIIIIIIITGSDWFYCADDWVGYGLPLHTISGGIWSETVSLASSQQYYRRVYCPNLSAGWPSACPCSLVHCGHSGR